MKLKKSCFNKTIFKKNMTRYWLLFAAYFGYLLLMLPINIWFRCNDRNAYYENLSQSAKQLQIISRALEHALNPLPIFVFAVLFAMALFYYLYTPRTAHMMHAFPVNRLELFVTNYITGICFMLVPQLFAFVAAVLVCLANQITCIEFLFEWLLLILGMSLFAFSMAVFVAMFTGNIIALPVYYFILNYLYMGCLYLVKGLVAAISYGVSDRWNPGKSCILSPLYYMNNNVRVGVSYEQKSGTIEEIYLSGFGLVAGYAVAGLVLAVAAYRIYRRRNIETAGDIISVGVIKPVFRWGMSICGGIALTQIVGSLILEYIHVNAFGCIMAFALLFCSLLFVAAEVLLKKSLRIWNKKVLLECAACVAVVLLGIALIKLDILGIKQRIPDAQKVEQAFIYMDYPIAVQEMDVNEVLAIQQSLIDNEKKYTGLSESDSDNSIVYFRYYMKDGSTFERKYCIPLTEEELADDTAPAAKIREMEKRSEYVKQRLLLDGIDEATAYFGYIERYNSTGMTDTYVFRGEELDILTEALKKDIEAGNFSDYLFSDTGEDGSYSNSIGLEYTGNTEYRSAWEYYENYRSYQEKETEVLTSESTFFRFGPKCRYTLEVLDELGVFNEEWKLYTEDEYDELMGY